MIPNDGQTGFTISRTAENNVQCTPNLTMQGKFVLFKSSLFLAFCFSPFATSVMIFHCSLTKCDIVEWDNN